MIIKKDNWSICVETLGNSAKISGGNFGSLTLKECPLFTAELKEITSGKTKTVTSCDNLKKLDFKKDESKFELSFEITDNVYIVVSALFDDKGISWETNVINNSDNVTVLNVSYPTVKIWGESITTFLPQFSGRELKNYNKNDSKESFVYPAHWSAEMQFYAFYNSEGGIYMGIHDPHASMKTFNLNCLQGTLELVSQFPSIKMGSNQNSFKLGGSARWEYIEKDWYDATTIYAEFVHKEAKWLPEKSEKGKNSIPQRFKEIPLWIVDYIPNSEKQMDARPMILGTVSQLYDKNYWFEAPIELKKKLGVPIAYHVYNWHEIPFNINYPHFTPAKDEFKKGLKHLKDEGICVLPYINAISWETKDKDEGFEINFENTGIKGATIKYDGEIAKTQYPQVKKSGEKTDLAPICPGFLKWHDIIGNVVKEIEETLDVDGVYFDEIAAHRAYPCMCDSHNHLAGGGSHWSDNYNLMMSKIRKNKPKDNYYFTESNCEGYIKGFDGMLTWLWKMGDMVPAFPCIYSEYIQMIGRFTDGLTRNDDNFFRFHLAQELVFGQVLGWIHPNVVYNDKRMDYLKKLVDVRYKYTELFSTGKLLRPPVIKSNVPPVESSDITMEQIIGGLWQMPQNGKKVLFVINVSQEKAKCTVDCEIGKADLELEPMQVYVKEF